MYGAETRVAKEVDERKLDVAEMRMLRWTCGVTKRKKLKASLRDTLFLMNSI